MLVRSTRYLKTISSFIFFNSFLTASFLSVTEPTLSRKRSHSLPTTKIEIIEATRSKPIEIHTPREKTLRDFSQVCNLTPQSPTLSPIITKKRCDSLPTTKIEFEQICQAKLNHFSAEVAQAIKNSEKEKERHWKDWEEHCIIFHFEDENEENFEPQYDEKKYKELFLSICYDLHLIWLNHKDYNDKDITVNNTLYSTTSNTNTFLNQLGEFIKKLKVFEEQQDLFEEEQDLQVNPVNILSSWIQEIQYYELLNRFFSKNAKFHVVKMMNEHQAPSFAIEHQKAYTSTRRLIHSFEKFCQI